MNQHYPGPMLNPTMRTLGQHLVSRADAAALLGVSVGKVVAMIRAGTLREVRLGYRCSRIDVRSIDTLLASQQEPVEPRPA